MTFRSEEQLAAIAHFEGDYFPTLAQGIISKDIVKAMRHDFAILIAEPKVELAVPVATSAPEIAPVDPFEADIEKAVEFVGIRDTEPAPKPKRGKHA
jgi:hypothetical protein